MTASFWRTELAHGISESTTYDYDAVVQFTLATLPAGSALCGIRAGQSGGVYDALNRLQQQIGAAQ